MRKLTTIILLFCALTMKAQVTQVSGTQSGTWNGEIHVVGDVVVPRDEALNIEAGTSVIADGYFEILVYGKFYANGEENARITFSVADTTGYSNYNAFESGAWKGMTFSKSEEVKLSHCDFSYGKTHLDGDGGIIRIYTVRGFEADNCTFHHNTARKRGGALYAENSIVDIHDCEIFENLATGYEGSYCWGTGFQFLKCDVTINDIVFHDNNSDVGYGGGMNIDSCNMVMNNAVFYNNYAVNAGGLGIQRCKEYTVKVSNMLAYNNSVKHYGGGLAMATSDPELNNLTIVNNFCGGGGGAGMQMAFNSEPTLNNCIFWGNRAVYEIEKDSIEYYLGSQIWLWGDDCVPMFNNGLVQYGLDTIAGYYHIPDGNYNNMLKTNPLFVDEVGRDYQLLTDSPCINAGTADISGLFIPDADLAGNPRVYNGRIDMGCYEWNNIGVDENYTNDNAMVVYPNPLNDNAFCVVDLDRQKDVVLRLVSLDGKEICRKNCGVLEAGEQHIPLDGIMNKIEKGNKVYLIVIDNQCIKIIY